MSSYLFSRKVTRKRKAKSEDGNPKPPKRRPRALVTEEAFQTISNLTPGEQVLRIPHLAEKILRSSQLSDVLNWRLVSSHLNLSAIHVIQQRIFLCFRNFWLHPRQIGKTLAAFNCLIKQRRSWPIPLTKFSFNTLQPKDSVSRMRGLNYDVLLTFLQVQGNHITELDLQVPNIYPLRESEVISHVKNLLTLVPNLEKLYISHTSVVEWVTKGKNDKSSLTLEDPEYIELHSEQNVILNTKLKFLTLGFSVSAKLCEMIIIRSPNLREIVLSMHWYVNFLLEPIPRIYLLKKMSLRADPHYFQMYEKVNQQLKLGGNFTIGVVIIQVWETDFNMYLLDESEMSEFVAIVNDLLELVADTVEHLEWIGVAPLNSLKWPQVMPRVKRLCLKTFCRMEDLVEDGESYPTQEFKILSKFPALRTISFSDFHEHEFMLLGNIFVENTFPSVKDVSYNRCKCVNSAQEEIETVMQKLFPNTTARMTSNK